MGKSKIEWTDRVWNPVTGCTKISEGCLNCYAERMSKRFAGTWGLPEDDYFGIRIHQERLEDPLRWKKPSRIFVCSMADIFHEDIPDNFIRRVFQIIEQCCPRDWDGKKWLPKPRHTFLILTKRPERMKKFIENYMDDRLVYAKKFDDCPTPEMRNSPAAIAAWQDAKMLSPHIWLGVTAENQQRADERIPTLLQIPAAVRFVSVEPMLGPVDLDQYLPVIVGHNRYHWERGDLDWVICGGESGPGARPMNPDWVRRLRDQCVYGGIPFFFKQWGEYCYPEQMKRDTYRETDSAHNLAGHGEYNKPWRVGKKKAGRELDGRTWDEYPQVMR